VRYAVVILLGVLAFLSYFDRVCITRAQGDIQRDTGISDADMGKVFGAFWLAYAIFDIPGGWLGDRFGARKTLARIVLAWSIFTALTGSAFGFVSLYAYRFAFGASQAGAFPNTARVQSRWIPAQHQGRISGIIWLVARWGGALSPLLFGILLRRVDSPAFRGFFKFIGLQAVSGLPAWRLAFWVCGLLGVGWVLLFYPFFRDDPADHRRVNAAELQLITSGRLENQRHPRPRYNLAIWLSLALSIDLWALAMCQALGSFGWSFFVSWLPRFLKQGYGVEYANSEVMSSLPLLCGGAACFIGGWMSDRIIRATGRHRFGRAVLPIIGRFGGAIAIFGVRYASTPGSAIALMCLSMILYDLSLGPTWAAAIEVGGIYSGTATGFVNTVGNLGNIVQPIVGQWIFAHFGWNRLFLVFAVFYVLSGSMWFIVNPTRRFYREEDVPPADLRAFPVHPEAARQEAASDSDGR
jgi:MFS family permease